MSRREPLGFKVGANAYASHKDEAKRRYGDVSGSVGKATREAILEFIDEDRYAPVEERIDELLGETMDKKSDRGEKKTTIDDVADETTVAGPRVGVDVKDRAKEKAAEWGVSPGVLATYAFREYASGGRPARLLDKLDRLAGVLDEGEDDRSTTERIVDRVTDPTAPTDAFTTDDVVEAADAEGVTTTDYAIEKYLPRVLDETGYVPRADYDDGTTRYFPRDTEPAPDHPDPGALPYKAMSDEDLRLALQVELVRRADRGRPRLTVSEARSHINGQPQKQTIRDALKRAGEMIAFEYQERHRGGSDEPRLVVDPDEYPADLKEHRRILQIAGYYDDETADSEPTGDDASSTDTTAVAADGGAETDDVDEDPDGSTGTDDSHPDPDHVQTIVEELGDEFTRDDVEAAMARTVAGDHETITAYTEPVVEAADVARHPNNEDLYIPPDRAAELADDNTDDPTSPPDTDDSEGADAELDRLQAAYPDRPGGVPADD